jgi:hypothetical protein
LERLPFTAFVQAPHDRPEKQLFIPGAGRIIVAEQDANNKGD